MILVMQRLSILDPAAHLEETEPWIKLTLPARAEADVMVPLAPDSTYSFRKEDLLHAERLDEAYLAKQRIQMGEASFLAQYQQRPIPGGGGLIDITRFRRYGTFPKEHDGCFMSIDAASGSDSGSFSVIQIFQITDGRLYMTDSHRGRWPFPELRNKVIELQEQLQIDAIVIEKAFTGYALAEELWDYYPTNVRGKIVQAITPSKSKIIRMEKAMVSVEAEKVLLPETADWLAGLINELLAFPEGINDDQVDALSQGIYAYNEFLKRPHLLKNERSGFFLVKQAAPTPHLDYLFGYNW